MQGEASGPEFSSDHRPASVRFALVPVGASAVGQVVRTVAVLAINAVNFGAGPSNPGGTGVHIVDRERGGPDGEVVGEVREQFADDAVSAVDEVRADLDRLDVASFAARWL